MWHILVLTAHNGERVVSGNTRLPRLITRSMRECAMHELESSLDKLEAAFRQESSGGGLNAFTSFLTQEGITDFSQGNVVLHVEIIQRS